MVKGGAAIQFQGIRSSNFKFYKIYEYQLYSNGSIFNTFQWALAKSARANGFWMHAWHMYYYSILINIILLFKTVTLLEQKSQRLDGEHQPTYPPI